MKTTQWHCLVLSKTKIIKEFVNDFNGVIFNYILKTVIKLQKLKQNKI